MHETDEIKLQTFFFVLFSNKQLSFFFVVCVCVGGGGGVGGGRGEGGRSGGDSY